MNENDTFHNGDSVTEYIEDYPYFFSIIEDKKIDNINPKHYKKGKVECIDAMESATVGKSGLEAVCVSQVIKYLWRYEGKNGLEDVKKAEYYFKRLINNLENK